MISAARALSAVGLAIALVGAGPAHSDPPAQNAAVQAAPAAPAPPVQVAWSDATPVDAAYVLIGSDPADEYEIERATIENGAITRFDQDGPAERYNADVSGFILLKVTPGEVLAIRATQVNFDANMRGPRFKPCGKTIAFSARAGTVGYVAHLRQDTDDDIVAFALVTRLIRFTTEYNSDIGSARAYLAQVHPPLVGKLEQAQTQMAGLPRHLSCESPF